MADTYYDVLGLSRKPSKDDLLLGYMQLACKWHPENHGNSAEAVEKFRLVGEAFCVLYDTKARFGYDKSLATNPEGEKARRLGMTLEKTLAVFAEMTTRYVESDMQRGLTEPECVAALTSAGCPLEVAQCLAGKIFAEERSEVQKSGYIMLGTGAGFFSLGAGILLFSFSASGGKSYVIWYWPLGVGLALMLYAFYCIGTGRRALSVSALFAGENDNRPFKSKRRR